MHKIWKSKCGEPKDPINIERERMGRRVRRSRFLVPPPTTTKRKPTNTVRPSVCPTRRASGARGLVKNDARTAPHTSHLGERRPQRDARLALVVELGRDQLDREERLAPRHGEVVQRPPPLVVELGRGHRVARVGREQLFIFVRARIAAAACPPLSD